MRKSEEHANMIVGNENRYGLSFQVVKDTEKII